jgi:hypothetical protein
MTCMCLTTVCCGGAGAAGTTAATRGADGEDPPHAGEKGVYWSVHARRLCTLMYALHTQDFVDKFRYNAKRASLVQSRIKAIEREEVLHRVAFMTPCLSSHHPVGAAAFLSFFLSFFFQVVEAVEEDDKGFQFFFTDAGELGRPVIQLEDVTFGYSSDKVMRRRSPCIGLNELSRAVYVASRYSLSTCISGSIRAAEWPWWGPTEQVQGHSTS